MNFDFFTLGGRFRWEDIYNFKNWRIQRHTKAHKYRLLDSHNIRRESGSFSKCQNTLLKYIRAYELDENQDDTVIILHNFARTRNSVQHLADSLQKTNKNIITVNYDSLHKNIDAHVQLLSQFLKNIEIKKNLYFINIGASCLITRQLINSNNTYHLYNIAGVLDINPMNSGSDLAELLSSKRIFRHIFGPMLSDIKTHQALNVPKLPQDIPHGIIFCPSILHSYFKKLFARFESFPYSTPPSEQSYADKIKYINPTSFFPLNDRDLALNCMQFLLSQTFVEDDENS